MPCICMQTEKTILYEDENPCMYLWMQRVFESNVSRCNCNVVMNVYLSVDVMIVRCEIVRFCFNVSPS
jgi:hypothetical protein